MIMWMILRIRKKMSSIKFSLKIRQHIKVKITISMSYLTTFHNRKKLILRQPKIKESQHKKSAFK